MKSDDVLRIYKDLVTNRIPIWIDGGWCVDVLIGAQTREHSDLDIAVDRKHAKQLSELLLSWGYKNEPRDDSSEWNFVMEDGENRIVDVHVFEYDESGRNVYGIEYPFGSLTGEGSINGQKIHCISPEWMFKFKTAYDPEKKDLKDVQALSEKFGFTLPESHRATS